MEPLYAPVRARALTLSSLALAAALAACESSRLTQGECRDVYGADVCTYAAWSGETLQELGVTFPIAAAENVPESMEMKWPPAPIAILALPEGVEAATGFTHFELNWEHHGHPPDAFMEPHFDFHFYTISSADLSEVDCLDETKPSRLPEGFVLPDARDPQQGVLTGLCVPSMGMHAMPRQELERDDRFTATMLVGFYSGEVIFLEPMVSRATLLERSDFTLPVPSLEGLAEELDPPTSFRAEYEESTGVYRFVFGGFGGR